MLELDSVKYSLKKKKTFTSYSVLPAVDLRQTVFTELSIRNFDLVMCRCWTDKSNVLSSFLKSYSSAKVLDNFSIVRPKKSNIVNQLLITRKKVESVFFGRILVPTRDWVMCCAAVALLRKHVGRPITARSTFYFCTRYS